jgi:carboxy-terminal domain RNA polymerase II polypeptide A small phosphatase
MKQTPAGADALTKKKETGLKLEEISRNIAVTRHRLLFNKSQTPQKLEKPTSNQKADLQLEIKPDSGEKQDRLTKILNIYAFLGPDRGEETPQKKDSSLVGAKKSSLSIEIGSNLFASSRPNTESKDRLPKHGFVEAKDQTPLATAVKLRQKAKAAKQQVGKPTVAPATLSSETAGSKFSLLFGAKQPQGGREQAQNRTVSPSNAPKKLQSKSVEKLLASNSQSRDSSKQQALFRETNARFAAAPQHMSASGKERILDLLNLTKEKLNHSQHRNFTDSSLAFKPQFHSKLLEAMAVGSRKMSLAENRSLSSTNLKSGQSVNLRSYLGRQAEPSYFERIRDREYLAESSDRQFMLFVEDVQEQTRVWKSLERLRTGFERKVACLAPSVHRRCVFLDLDETLVRTEQRDNLKAYDEVLQMAAPDGKTEVSAADQALGVLYRPYLRSFLERAHKAFELVVFTAARKDYADQVLDKVDPHKRYFSGRLYRDHCEQLGGTQGSPDFFIKDIRAVGGRPLRDCILVDNLAYSFAPTPENGLLIKPYLGSIYDSELKHLASCLEQWSYGVEASIFLESFFGQREFLEFARSERPSRVR